MAMRKIVLPFACLVVLICVLRGVTATASTNDTRCARVRPGRVTNLCKLNTTPSCEENLKIALHGCLLGVILFCVLLILLVFLIVLVCFICCWYYRKKQHKASSDLSEPLLDQSKQSNSSAGRPIKSDNELSLMVADVDNNDVHQPGSESSLAQDKEKGNKEKGRKKEKNDDIHPSRTESARDEKKEKEKLLNVKQNDNLHRPRSESSIARDEERGKEINKEKTTTNELSKEMFKDKSNQRSFKLLPELGSRLQKYWNVLETREDGKVLQATIKASKQSLLTLDDPNTIDSLRLLFKHIRHPYLQAIVDITYKKDYVGILQQYAQEGSVRDYLFKCNPEKDWSVKYTTDGGNRTFKKEEISKCGYQVLKAAEILYGLGFSHIGQIHSGNVFIISGNYILGGYENSLLGYRTSMYQALNQQGLLNKIDIIMFGHLLYEMSTSRPLTEGKIPEESDYENVRDVEIQKVIRFVFDISRRTGIPKELMQQIALHSFFRSSLHKKPQNSYPIELPTEAARLLSTVFQDGLKIKALIESLDGKYEAEVHFPQLGWRCGKMWAKARHAKLNMEGLLTAFAVPQNCPIYVKSNIAAIRKLLLLKHDFLFSIKDMDYIIVDGQHIIIIFQDMVEKGSLRDIIYQVPPTAVHASKYETKGVKMKADQVALYGTQLVQAISYLHQLDKQESPLTLGYVHTGNIFMNGSTCRLSGFENTLLGHQPKWLLMFEEHSTSVDAYMFGHVIFEMSTGRELMTAVPNMEDYREVPRELHQVLQYIFGTDSVNFEEIMKLLQAVSKRLGQVDLVGSETKRLDGGALFVLEKVRKGKPRDQDSQLGKGKHLLQANFRKV